MTIAPNGFDDDSHDRIAAFLDYAIREVKSAGIASWVLQALDALYGSAPAPGFDCLDDVELTLFARVLEHWIGAAERTPEWWPPAAVGWIVRQWVAADEAIEARALARDELLREAAVEAAAEAAAPFRGPAVGGVIDEDGRFLPRITD